MYTFTAQYNSGSCYECGIYLTEGDLLTYDADDNLCHAECVEAVPTDQPALFDFESARAARQS